MIFPWIRCFSNAICKFYFAGDLNKAKAIPHSNRQQENLKQPLPSTNSYKQPVRNLKHIDRTAEKPETNKGDNRVFRFLINQRNACSRNKSEIVLIVMSRAGGFLRRRTIRDTWASVVSDYNSTIFFLVGRPVTSTSQSQIETEAKLYRDILQVDIEESYNYLTYKSIAMLQWFYDYCHVAKYLMKADDDVYVNFENVYSSINKKYTSTDRFFLCHVFRKAPPIRDLNSKWYTSFEEYNNTFFPTYCSGTAYLFSSVILGDLYQSALKASFLTMEDVFLTGMAAENLHVRYIHDPRLSYEKREPTGCSYKHAISGHGVTAQEMIVIFAQIFNKEIDCETNENLVIKNAEEYD